jgi:hypothetical protein
MRRFVPLIAVCLAGACSMPDAGPEPSLAPRPAEAIDPRVPIPGTVPSGPADAALAARLGELVGTARAGSAQFDARLANAERLAGAAGPMASESWVAAQQALSLLIEQYGVTTRAAADIDALASSRLEGQRWIRPTDQQAISAAAAEVSAISEPQAAAIERLQNQLGR